MTFTTELLRDLQLTQVKMLSDFDDICKKHDITYYLAFGSALGAVRHKGFIPWDDDIDILMIRSDFEKLNAVVGDYLGDKYEWVPKKVGGCLCLKGTTYVSHGYLGYDMKHYVRIGVDVLDYRPKNSLLVSALWLYKWASAVVRLPGAKFTNFCLNVSNVFFKRARFDALLSKVIANTKPTDKYIRWSGLKYKWHTDCTHPSDWFCEPVLLEFEGELRPLPTKYEEFLLDYFGPDYMTPPPEDQRQMHHLEQGLVDLNRPYTDYMINDDGKISWRSL